MNETEDKKIIAETDIVREKGYVYVCAGNPIKILRVKAGRKKKLV